MGVGQLVAKGLWPLSRGLGGVRGHRPGSVAAVGAGDEVGWDREGRQLTWGGVWWSCLQSV